MKIQIKDESSPVPNIGAQGRENPEYGSRRYHTLVLAMILWHSILWTIVSCTAAAAYCLLSLFSFVRKLLETGNCWLSFPRRSHKTVWYSKGIFIEENYTFYSVINCKRKGENNAKLPCWCTDVLVLCIIVTYIIYHIAKLSQKSKQKLQLLAERVIISFNPPTHPDKYGGDRIEHKKT